jgi:hypothetical protein
VVVGVVVGDGERGATDLPSESLLEAGSVPFGPAPGWPPATAAAQRAAAELGAELAPTAPPIPGSAGAPGSPKGTAAPDDPADAAATLAPAEEAESSFVSVVAANAARPLTNVAVTVIDAANADRLSMCDTS